MLFSFKDYNSLKHAVLESEENTAVITFGRFNPPTLGHVKVMNKIKDMAEKYNGIPMVFLSHVQDQKKNPLPYDDKVKYLRLASPSGVRIIETQAKTITDIILFLSSLRFSRVVFVVGMDRVEGFKYLEADAQKYNMKEIKIVSAGNRGEGDLDNIENLSSSILRQLAVEGRRDEFIKYCAVPDNKSVAEEMYTKVRINLGFPQN